MKYLISFKDGKVFEKTSEYDINVVNSELKRHAHAESREDVLKEIALQKEFEIHELFELENPIDKFVADLPDKLKRTPEDVAEELAEAVKEDIKNAKNLGIQKKKSKKKK